VATVVARSWHVRSKTWCAAWRRQSLLRGRRELAASENVSTSQEKTRPRALDLGGNCTASARCDRRRFRPRFEEIDKIDIKCSGKKHRNSAIREPERRKSECLFRRRHPE